VNGAITMAEDRDKWKKYVHGVANPRIEPRTTEEQNRTEQNRSKPLPVFTAVNLSRIPFLNPDSVNLVSVLRMMESFEQRLKEMEKCYTRQANIYAAAAPRSESLVLAGTHSVLTSDAHVDDLDSIQESDTDIINDDERILDLEANAGAQTSGDDNSGSRAWNVVARRQRKKGVRTESTEDTSREVGTTQDQSTE